MSAAARPAQRRRGFTALELAMALAIAATLLLGVFGLFASMQRSDRLLAARFRDLGALLRAHETLRYAFQTILAPTPDDLFSDSGQSPASSPPAADAQKPVLEEENTPSDEPRFELVSYTEQEGKAIEKSAQLDEPLDAEQIASVMKYIKVALARSPLATLPSYYWGVWGAFESVPYNGGWALLWTPIDPPGEPVVLIDDARLILASCLAQGGTWTTNLRASDKQQMPRAIRVIVWTRGGAKLDWLFEPGFVYGETP